MAQFDPGMFESWQGKEKNLIIRQKGEEYYLVPLFGLSAF